VRFVVQAPLRDVVWCHCSRCQRFHGGPGPYTTVPRAQVRFRAQHGLAWWKASKTVLRGICRECGASLFFSDSSSPELTIAAGALVPPTGLRSTLHLFVGSKPDWYSLDQVLPKRKED
jgi:hypothetical protein